MTWLVNESRALKEKLSDIYVHATNAPEEGLNVPVHFVGPDLELADVNYPGIYIRYGPMIRATDREHEGSVLLPYAPEGFSGNVQVPVNMEDETNMSTEPWLVPGSFGDPLASPYKTADIPRPYNLHFDINVVARNYQQAVELTGQLAKIQYLPERFGFLEIPEDGTVRTLELLGGPEIILARDADDKRVLQILYSVNVVSELNLYDIEQISRVTSVDLTVTSYNPLLPPQ